ncbi:MAG: transposase [Acidaminococcus sp.]|jgi:putative transposase|nr:transposase [Acidaminococcus sp.]
MVRTFGFKLFRAKRNKKLHRQINAAGMAYNHCIALHKRYWKLYHKSLNLYALQKHLTKLKKIPRFAYLKEIGSQALQDVTQRIDRGYKLFWENLKRERKTAPPGFRKVRKYKSYTLKQAGWKLDQEHGIVYIAKQKYRYAKSRNIEGKIKTLTVKRDSLGDIYLYFTCELPDIEVGARTGKSVGFDFGFNGKMLIAENPEEDIREPGFFRKARNEIARANRKLSRKRMQSNNRCRARQELARLHRRIANQRNAFHWQLARELCSRYAVICLEDLNMKFMQKGHGKKVMDYGLSEFENILAYVGRQVGTRIVKVDPYFPSSQLCSECSYKNPEMKDLRIREWVCPACGSHHDRDRNAARNIHQEGLRILESA